MRRTVVTIVVMCVLGAYAPAVAQADEVTLDTSRVDGIRWVTAAVMAEDADVVRIKIFAPQRSGGRELFQKCRFPFSGSGDYSCGFDVTKGAPARRYRGEWIARAMLDGERAARIKFHL